MDTAIIKMEKLLNGISPAAHMGLFKLRFILLHLQYLTVLWIAKRKHFSNEFCIGEKEVYENGALSSYVVMKIVLLIKMKLVDGFGPSIIQMGQWITH